MPEEPHPPDLDAAVVRSLCLLTEGDPSAFRKTTAPPRHVTSYLARATPAELHGLLIATLSAWHESKTKKEPPRHPPRCRHGFNPKPPPRHGDKK